MTLETFELGPKVQAEMVESRIVVVDFAIPLDDASFDAYLDATLALVDARQPTVTVVHIRTGAHLTLAQRSRQAAFFHEHSSLFRARTLGMAYVAEATSAWLALHAFFLVEPPQWPFLVTRSLDDALAWARELRDASHESGGRVGSA